VTFPLGSSLIGKEYVSITEQLARSRR
jgi:hypothetical protein